MKKAEIEKRAKEEAAKAFGISDGFEVPCEEMETTEAWDQGICKNVFEATFRIWKPVEIMHIEMNAETGEVLSLGKDRTPNE